MIVTEADLEFDFSNAVAVIKFDDDSHGLSHCMKAVDFVVELASAYLFVEVKDPSNPRANARSTSDFQVKTTSGKLRKDFVVKFRDSFVYRWAEGRLEKPILFLSLITLEEALLLVFQDDLRRHLPLDGSPRWSRKIADQCLVVNVEAWNRRFPQWPVRRLPSTQS